MMMSICKGASNVIAWLGPAADAINKAALTAEKMTKAPIENAVVGVGGPHIRGMNSQGGHAARGLGLVESEDSGSFGALGFAHLGSLLAGAGEHQGDQRTGPGE